MTRTWSLRALRQAATGACRATEGLELCSGVAIASPAGALSRAELSCYKDLKLER